jgi:hypothetical protein
MHALNWGATDGDMTRVMPGDAVVPHPNYETTMAIEIVAEPQAIWPWLVQMGYRRGGLYSYDWLDRLFGYLDRPSADRILPAFQNLREGDVIPIGRGQGVPVRMIESGRALVLGGAEKDMQWIWEFGLYPIGSGRTRLVSRNRIHVPGTIGWRLFMLVLSPAAFLMTRRMLIGIRRRAEGTGLFSTEMRA